MKDKNDKVLVITGASKGIGYATAQTFLDDGYRVINLSRSACLIDEVINIKIDLTEAQWKKSIVETLLEALGRTDNITLVHNAAMLVKDSVANVDADSLQEVINLNVIAPAKLNKLLLPLMKEGSSIVYISSTLGTKAVANTYSYVVSKHAVIGQMRATCQDLAGTQIHTACVCPGFTATEMLQEHLGENPEIYQQITSTIAHQRLAQPSEIANTIWFCSQNPVVNGSILHANLGQIEQ